MRRFTLLCSAALLFVAACGGSDSSSVTGGNNNTNGGTLTSGLTATIDGKSFVGASAAVAYKNAIVSFAGVEIASGIGLSVASGTVTGPGTYNLAAVSNGGLALITQNGASWSSAAPGGSGTLVITTLTANHIVATFSFDAPALTGGSTGTKHVTNGKIDATF